MQIRWYPYALLYCTLLSSLFFSFLLYSSPSFHSPLPLFLFLSLHYSPPIFSPHFPILSFLSHSLFSYISLSSPSLPATGHLISSSVLLISPPRFLYFVSVHFIHRVAMNYYVMDFFHILTILSTHSFPFIFIALPTSSHRFFTSPIPHLARLIPHLIYPSHFSPSPPTSLYSLPLTLLLFFLLTLPLILPPFDPLTLPLTLPHSFAPPHTTHLQP